MAGHSKSVHFPLSMGAGDSALHRKRERETRGAPERVPSTPKPSILVVGELGRDYLVFGDKLKSLHHSEADYHGSLQVMLSALRRMQDQVAVLIKEVEDQ